MTKMFTEKVFNNYKTYEYELAGRKLVIENGKARISHADCPDGICEEYRPISYVGETIICLPHKVVIEITGETADNGLDIVA